MVAVGGEIENLVAGGERVGVGCFIELPVALQTGFGAVQLALVVALDVVGRSRHVPDAHFVDLAGEVLSSGRGLPAADPEIAQGADTADGPAALIRVLQLAVGIGVDTAAVVDHGDVCPGVERRDIAGVDPGPARIAVGESPADRAIAEAGDLVLAFLVHDDAAARAPGALAGGTDPGFHGQAIGHGQAGRIADLDNVGGIAGGVLAVERERAAGQRRVGLDLGHHMQEVVVRHAGEAFARHQLPTRTRIGVFGGEQIGVEPDVLNRLEQHAGIDRLDHFDHVAGELAIGGGTELADRFRRTQHIPVATIAQVEVQPADDGSLADLRQSPGEERHIVARGHAVARLEFVGVRREDVIAGQQVSRRTAGDGVVAAEAHDDVGAGAAVDAIAIGAAEQAVIAIATPDVERREQRTCFEVAFLDAPFGAGVRELVLGVGVHHVIAATGVDHRVFHIDRLILRAELHIERRAVDERREPEIGDGGAARVGAEVESGAGGAEAQDAVRELDHHLARADRGCGIDQGLQIGGQVGECAVVVGDGLGERERDEVGAARHLQPERRVGGEPAGERCGPGRADDFLADHELLVRGIPLQGGELVAMQEDVVADRHEIGYPAAKPIDIATLEQHAIVARAAIEAVGERLQTLGAVLEQRRPIGNDLEGVVAVLAEQQILGLTVAATGEHVVAGAAEDPVFAGPALQHVVARAAENHVATLDHRLVGEIDHR